jgi:sulfoxide reductase heme-binding subunit YedZ
MIYIALSLTIVAIAVSAGVEAPDAVQTWVSARQYFGLAALGALFASVLAAPLIFVLPWLPINAHLARGRRALGVSAFTLAAFHVVSYLGPQIRWNWHAIYSPGGLWVTGLLFGAALFAGMGRLALTSTDEAVRRLGPKRWKKLHRSVYVLVPGVLIHAILVGADFGLNRGPDVKSQPDAGCLIGFALLVAAWTFFVVLRKRRLRWTPRRLRQA